MFSPRVAFAATIGTFFGCGLCSPLRARGVDFYAPTANGGSQLDDAGGGVGEPLNVIISGLSSADVLTDDGFVNFARSVGFSTECLGFHIGPPHYANLGDGNGWVTQSMELRQDYGDPYIGTCAESLIGGNHFRVYHQNGDQADSGALFLAVSKEEVTDSIEKKTFTDFIFESVGGDHNIIPDGYDIGRDELVRAALGETSYNGVSYSTTAEDIANLIAPGSEGIDHGIAQDGIVTLLTVTIVS